jgi:hypothetical protein
VTFRVKAPIKGFINKRFIEPGSMLAGMPATAMFEIVNVSSLKLTVTVDESQVANLKLGSPVDVTASVYPDVSLKNHSHRPKSRFNFEFSVEIEITNTSSNDLKAGMYGTALASKHKNNL